MNVNPFSYLIEKLKGKVDKSGDTMTGQLRINNNSDTPLVIKKASSSIGKVYLGFENSAETIGYFSVGADKKPYFTSGNGADVQIALTSDITPVDVSSEFTPDSCIDSFKAYRSGKIITLDATLKAQSYSSGQQLFTSTNAVKPVVSFAVTLTDSNDKPEQSGVVWIQTSNQHRYFGNSMSGKHYFTATYISQ